MQFGFLCPSQPSAVSERLLFHAFNQVKRLVENSASSFPIVSAVNARRVGIFKCMCSTVPLLGGNCADTSPRGLLVQRASVTMNLSVSQGYLIADKGSVSNNRLEVTAAVVVTPSNLQ